jgi:hypothetical protein
MFALGDRVAGRGWLALHLVLLVRPAAPSWSEGAFAAALPHAAPVGERAPWSGRWGSISGSWRCSAGSISAARFWRSRGCLAGVVVLAHAVGLTTLWPTVPDTRMLGVERAVRWSLPPMIVGLTVAAAGLLVQRRAVVLAGPASYVAGLAMALAVPGGSQRCLCCRQTGVRTTVFC